MEKIKLPKFELEQLTVAEMDAIKAGSGTCQSGNINCWCDTGDADTMFGDTDDD